MHGERGSGFEGVFRCNDFEWLGQIAHRASPGASIVAAESGLPAVDHYSIHIYTWSRCIWMYVGYPASSRRRTAIPSALRASRPFIDTKRTVSLSSRATVPACLICHSGRVCPKARGAGLNSKVCETGQTSSRSCPLDKVKSSPEWGVE